MRLAPYLVPSLICCLHTGHAADTVMVIDEVHISATQVDGDARLQPYAVSQLTRADMAYRQGRTMFDSLHGSVGVAMQRTAANQASPYVRGLTGEQTLVLFDGVRMNHAMMRPGPNQYTALIPQSSIATVDIILGSAATVVGSDGLTGALDFRLAEAGRGQTAGIQATADAQYGSADNGGRLVATLDGRQGGWAWTAEVSASRYNNLRAGAGAGADLFGDSAGQRTVPNTAYDQQSYNARTRYDALESHIFELSLGSVQQDDAPRADGYAANTGQSQRISRSFPQQDFSYLHARHYWLPEMGNIQEIQTTLWYHQHDEQQRREDIRNSGTPTEQYRRRAYDNRIATTGIDTRIAYTIGNNHALSTGFTWFTDNTANSYREFRAPVGDTSAANASEQALTPDAANAKASVPDDSSYTGIGIYAQDHWQFSRTWSLLTGIRYSRYQWNADVTDRDFAVDTIDGSADAITTSARIAYDRDEHWHSFAGISQGFRAPNLTNLTGADGVGSTAVTFAGNPELNPELSLSYEIGIRYDIADAPATDTDRRSYIALNLFHTTIDDIIQRVYRDIDGDSILDPIVANGRSARLQGFELHHNYALPFFAATGTLSTYAVTNYVDAEEDTEQADGSIRSDNMSRANRLFGVLGITYRHHNRWWGATNIRWSAAYNQAAPSDANDLRLTIPGNANGELPGYALLDLKAGWKNASESHTYSIGINNLLDKKYRDIGSSTNGAGINLVLSIHASY